MHAANLQPAISMIEDFCEQFVIGRNPVHIDRAFGRRFTPRGTIGVIPACI